MRKLLFRADGNAAIGLGHVIRSLALAEMLKNQFHCVFAIQQPGEALQVQIRETCAGLIVLPAATTAEELLIELDPHLTGDELVVLDGYKFGTPYQMHIKNKGCGLACIDDIHADHFVADLVINHGTNDGSVYSKDDNTKLLLGTSYSLLRDPFLKAIQNRPAPAAESNVFLCFGGSDALNLTCTYIERLARIEEVASIQVVVGSAYEYNEALQQVVEENKGANIHVHRNITADEMVQLVSECKVAVVPGSTVAIECASVGVGIICGYYVDNQHDIVNMLAGTGLAHNAGDLSCVRDADFANCLRRLLDEDATAYRQRSSRYFDDSIKDRYRKAFNRLFTQNRMRLRKAAPTDVNLLFSWANESAVRKNAINGETISFENHSSWFEKKLAASTTFIYMAAIDGVMFGQVRFDGDADSYLIDYSISDQMRGKGLASVMLEKAIDQLRADLRQPLRLKAVVKSGNTASIRVFQTLNFASEGGKQIKNEDYLVFEKQL